MCDCVRSKCIYPVDLLEFSTAGRRTIALDGYFDCAMGSMNILAEDFRFLTRVLGSLRYHFAGFLSVLEFQSPMLNIDMKLQTGEWKRLTMRVYVLTIDNIQHWTDDMRVVPSARLDTGTLTLTIFPEKNYNTRLQRILSILSIDDALYLDMKQTEVYEATEVLIHFSSPVGVFNVDGEDFWRDEKLQIKVLPASMNIFLPETAKAAM